jgi:5-methyltetrahydropteroyltriglutamate--homocysteine methyltransferase
MATRSGPAIHHADHCGSLLRPQRLREARRDHALGKLSAEALRDIEDREILAVLELQRAVGLGIYSDGEFRRKVWNQAMEAFDGVADAGPNFERFPLMRKLDLAANPELAAVNPVVTGRLRRKGRFTAEESAFLRKHAPGPYKITMPSPAMVSRKWLARAEGRAAYPHYDALVHDVARLLAEEAGALADEGVPYIQLDAPGYRQFMVAGEMEKMRAQGLDPEHEFETLIEAENLILRSAKRPGNSVAVHICHGTYVFDGRGASGGGPAPYDPARAAELYQRLEADVFLVEYTERGGGPESLKDAPQDKIYCMGVQNIRDPRIETADEIMRKIEGASKYVPLANLALCPNCGFSGAAADAWITPDIQKRKLEVLVETAAKIW